MKADDYNNIRDARIICDMLSLALRPAKGKKYPSMDDIRKRVEAAADKLAEVVPRRSPPKDIL